LKLEGVDEVRKGILSINAEINENKACSSRHCLGLAR